MVFVFIAHFVLFDAFFFMCLVVCYSFILQGLKILNVIGRLKVVSNASQQRLVCPLNSCPIERFYICRRTMKYFFMILPNNSTKHLWVGRFVLLFITILRLTVRKPNVLLCVCSFITGLQKCDVFDDFLPGAVLSSHRKEEYLASLLTATSTVNRNIEAASAKATTLTLEVIVVVFHIKF